MRTLIVGDVHGCRQELEALLASVALTRDDRLVLAGDLVSKGPDSAGVVRLAREWNALMVRGNHDDHLLACAEGEPQRGIDYLETLKAEDLAYLRSAPYYLRFEELGTAGVIVVHAGLVPGVALKKQKPKWMTTMRSLDRRGKPSKFHSEGAPWARQWEGPELVVFGHDAILGLQWTPFAIGLDTGCVYGGRLTAALFEGEGCEPTLVSVPAERRWCVIG